MTLRWQDIAFEPGAAFGASVAEAWEWLTDRKDLKPFLCSKIGDVFCTDALGAVHWLDCSGGKLKWITPSRVIFDAECEKGGAKVDEWFGPKLVEKCHAAGKIAGDGEAYMFVTLPIFADCTFEPDNVKISPASDVFLELSEIHKLYVNIPGGAYVRSKIVD